MFHRMIDGRLFFDRGHGIHRIPNGKPSNRAESMQLGRWCWFDGGHNISVVYVVCVDELAGAAIAVLANVDVIAEEQKERLISDKLATLIDRVPVTLGRLLHGITLMPAPSWQVSQIPAAPIPSPAKAGKRS